MWQRMANSVMAVEWLKVIDAELLAAAAKQVRRNAVQKLSMLNYVFHWNFGVVDVFSAISGPLCFPLFVPVFHVFRFKAVDALQGDMPIDCKNPGDLSVLGDDHRIHVMVGREATGQLDVDGLEFVLTSRPVFSIVAFSSGKDFQPQEQKNLKNLAAIVLKNVINAVLTCKALVLFDRRPECLHLRKVGV